MRKILALLILIPLTFSAGNCRNAISRFYVQHVIKPSGAFEAYTPPPAPDYSKQENWLAFPGKKSDALYRPALPEFEKPTQAPRVDVFFVYPTTHLSRWSWNSDTRDLKLIRWGSPIKMQASIFNGVGRIFVPMHRQATLYAFRDLEGDGKKALALATSDVKRAFAYYLKHHNKGRPFILAGHSQGSYILKRVLKEFLDGKNDKRLVAAYLAGWKVNKSDYEQVKPCNGPEALGCFVTWNAVRWGTDWKDKPEQAPSYSGGLCVNPVSWKLGSETTPKTAHLGGVGVKMQQITRNLVETKCKDDYLWVKLPEHEDFNPFYSPNNFHVLDYNLFYMDIRENARRKVEVYFKKNK